MRMYFLEFHIFHVFARRQHILYVYIRYIYTAKIILQQKYSKTGLLYSRNKTPSDHFRFTQIFSFFIFHDNESNAASNKDKYNRNGLIKLPLSHDFIVKRSVFNSILIHIPNKDRIEKSN